VLKLACHDSIAAHGSILLSMMPCSDLKSRTLGHADALMSSNCFQVGGALAVSAMLLRPGAAHSTALQAPPATSLVEQLAATCHAMLCGARESLNGATGLTSTPVSPFDSWSDTALAARCVHAASAAVVASPDTDRVDALQRHADTLYAAVTSVLWDANLHNSRPDLGDISTAHQAIAAAQHSSAEGDCAQGEGSKAKRQRVAAQCPWHADCAAATLLHALCYTVHDVSAAANAMIDRLDAEADDIGTAEDNCEGVASAATEVCMQGCQAFRQLLDLSLSVFITLSGAQTGPLDSSRLLACAGDVIASAVVALQALCRGTLLLLPLPRPPLHITCSMRQM
jgi:hypothetical protein